MLRMKRTPLFGRGPYRAPVGEVTPKTPPPTQEWWEMEEMLHQARMETDQYRQYGHPPVRSPPRTRTSETSTYRTPETSTREDSEEPSLPPSPVPSLDIPTPRSLSPIEYPHFQPTSSEDEVAPEKSPLSPSPTPETLSPSPTGSDPEIPDFPLQLSPLRRPPTPRISLMSLHTPSTSSHIPQNQPPKPIPALMSLHIPRPANLPPSSVPSSPKPSINRSHKPSPQRSHYVRRAPGFPQLAPIPKHSPLLFTGCWKCNGAHQASICPIGARRCYFCGRWGEDVRTCPDCRLLP
ncbi:uncharacterized protein LOC135171607 [Diachasmimorpha longicaudata]|uniref:uncharacterized protein LOC135171607 n=1 Tax=Diachasmimorpha longicaudata TaxID=58733 RepID=UPI0030B8ED4B